MCLRRKEAIMCFAGMERPLSEKEMREAKAALTSAQRPQPEPAKIENKPEPQLEK